MFHGHDGLLRLMADWTEGFEEWSYRAEEYADVGDKGLRSRRRADAAAGLPG